MLRSHPTLDFHEKQRARRFLYSPLTFIILGILIIIAGYNAFDMYRKSAQTKESLRKSQDAYDVLLAREQFLNERLGKLASAAGVESEIRERFGVAKPGEEVIVVLSDEKTDPLPEEKEGWWTRFTSWWRTGSGDYVKE